MPRVAPKDGVERRNVYTRLNPSGAEEKVVTKKGHPDEETLNELARDLLGLIESISFGQTPALSAEQPLDQRAVNQNSPPQLVASRGDAARASGETLTNMTAPAPGASNHGLGMGPMAADSPELSRAKAPLSANPLSGRAISKYNRGSTGDGIVNGATHSESLGTGAIAFAPGLLGSQPPSSSKDGKKKVRRNENKDTTNNRLESRMSTRRTINEWLPPFKAAGYAPGEHTMPEPSGKGVADRTPTQDKVGAYDTELSGVGKEWPREGHDNEAMDRVDDENISHSAEGAHESTHGEPDDGHQKKHGHDWPAQPKNSGQGVAEPFGGDRWSDGGVLNGSGPGADTWTHTEGPGMPSDGPITGTDGPQLGHVSEHKSTWSPNNMARLMGEDADAQALFDSYARTRAGSAVCVEDFQALLNAHGTGLVVNEGGLLQMMADNQEFMFLEGRDSDGPYWTLEAITEGEQRRPFAGKRPLTEDITAWDDRPRSRDEEEGIDPRQAHEMEFGPLGDDHDPMSGIPDDIAGMAGHTPEGPGGMGGLGGEDELGLGDELGGGGLGGPLDGPGGGLGDEMGGLGGGMGGGLGGGQGGAGAALECPGCGYTGEDAECPECGGEMMEPGGLGDLGGPHGGLEPGGGPGNEALDLPPAGPRLESRSRVIVNGPAIVRCLKSFMESARSMIEHNPRAKNRDLAEALNHSWVHHAGRVDARTCPTAVKETLQGLMRKFPGFNPLNENQAMNKPEGTKLGGGDGPKVELPKQPTDMTTHGDKSLLGKQQNGKAMAKSGDDSLAGKLYLAGTGRGMNPGGSVSESAVAGAPGQGPGGMAVAGARPAARPGAGKPAAPVKRNPGRAVVGNPVDDVFDTGPKPVTLGGGRKPVGGAQPVTGAATKQVQENMARLGAHVKRSIQEGARALGGGKYRTVFSVLVAEGGKPAFLKGKKDAKKGGGKAPPFGKKDAKKDGGKAPPFGKAGAKKEGGKPDFLKKNRTPSRDNLAEALADAEEILQLHDPANVTFETTFVGANGQIALKQDIPLFTINPRGPMVGEGKALFRFHRNAEAFANELVAEGITCRVTPHNWGSAVEAKTNYSVAERVFGTLAECDDGCATRRRR